jgi:hypothetical protein
MGSIFKNMAQPRAKKSIWAGEKGKEVDVATLPYEEQVAIVGKEVADQLQDIKVSHATTHIVTNVDLKTKTITLGKK